MTGVWREGFTLEANGKRQNLKGIRRATKAPSRKGPVEIDAANRGEFVRKLVAARDAGRVVVPTPENLPANERRRRTAITADPKAGAEYCVFTSGTEGPAKGAWLSESGFAWHAAACAERIAADAASRWLLSLSPAHVGGLSVILRALNHGSTVVVPSEALPENLDPPIRSGKISHVSLVPAQLSRWLRRRGAGRAPATLRCVLLGGALASPELVASALEAGLPVQVTYGLTESSSQVATATSSTPPGSAGPPLPGIEVRVVDDAGRPVGAGTPGRILVRTPAAFRGYAGEPEQTGAALRDGWIWTQDRGRLDAAGNLWPLGRLDRVVNTGGLKVDPGRVEAELSTIPGVLEACAFGVPDPEWGEALVAVVSGDPDLELATLRASLAARLPRHEVPRIVERWPELPRTATGKLAIAEVRREWLSRHAG